MLQYSCTGNANQEFKFRPTDAGTNSFTVRPQHSSGCVRHGAAGLVYSTSCNWAGASSLRFQILPSYVRDLHPIRSYSSGNVGMCHTAQFRTAFRSIPIRAHIPLTNGGALDSPGDTASLSSPS